MPDDPREAGIDPVADAADEELGAELGALMAAVDDPAEAVLRAAEAAFAWRTIDVELAALTFDSADAELAAATRGGAVRRLAFEVDQVTLDVEIGPPAGGGAPVAIVVSSDLEGAVAGCATADGAASSAVVRGGTAALEAPGPGPVRLTLTTATGDEVLRTGWFLP